MARRSRQWVTIDTNCLLHIFGATHLPFCFASTAWRNKIFDKYKNWNVAEAQIILLRAPKECLCTCMHIFMYIYIYIYIYMYMYMYMYEQMCISVFDSSAGKVL